MSDAPVRMRDVVVIGGGCYGTFYAGQLARAKEKGRAEFRTVIIVDRDAQCWARGALAPAPDRRFIESEWEAFFDGFLDPDAPAPPPEQRDYIVPSPHMPHLMFEWVVRRARARFGGRRFEVVPLPGSLATPYDRLGRDGTRYVSFADWVCPTHCIEPATCPATGAARTWEMPEAVRALTERLRDAGEPVLGHALFVCRHHVYGVGSFAVDAVLDGARLVAQAAREPDGAQVLLGTVSSCHGALNLLRVRPADVPEDGR